jgi:hypothetical protein
MTPSQRASLTDEEKIALGRALDEYEQAQRSQDPVEFSTNVLGIKPWSKQAHILRMIAKHDRVAVRSGHKVGKSTLASIAALWWMKRWTDGRVVMTAPTGRQVRIVLWREVTRLHKRALVSMGGTLHKLPELGLQYDDGREILGFATDEPERIAGVSGAHILYIVDEGSGVTEEIFEAIEGSRAGGAKLLVLGNPTRTSGTFYNAFTSAADVWCHLHVSSEDSPNVTGEANIPGLATPQWVEEKRQEWGEESPLYQVRVRGNFPTQAENAVMGLALVEAARERYEDTAEDGPLSIGVDVARFGDDETDIQPVRGYKALQATVLRSMDTVDVAGRALKVGRELARPGERPVFKVDVIGVGAGVADTLRANGADVIDVNVGESANDDNYSRLRDELWFGLRDWLKDGGAIPDDGKLQADLLAPTYSFLPTGKIKVESKDEIKKRLSGRSPDRADGLALAVYPGRGVAEFSDVQWKPARRTF